MIWSVSRRFVCASYRCRSLSALALGILHRNRVVQRSLSTLASDAPRIVNILSRPATSTTKEALTAVGSLRTVRHQKHVSFAELGDGSTAENVQVVLKPELAKGLNTGTSVAITGLWRPAPSQAKQSRELLAQEVHILGEADETYPIQKKYHSPDYLRTIPHLRLRTPWNAALARLRSEADFHTSAIFREKGYVRVQTPIITSSDCEGAGEVFGLDARRATTSGDAGRITISPNADMPFFRSPKYLTVSSQLHLEAFVHEHPRIWTLSPTFRAEKSDTPRHVSEFWMLEAELRTSRLDDVMRLSQEFIANLVARLGESGLRADLEATRHRAVQNPDLSEQAQPDLAQRWHALSADRDIPWPRVTYTEAISHLTHATVAFEHQPSWRDGLRLEHERYLVSTIGKGKPVFITHYPATLKPFYMLPSEVAGAQPVVECFDLLLPGVCEVVGGSLREHRADKLVQAMRAHGMSAPSSTSTRSTTATTSQLESNDGDLDWYLDLRRYGSVPHGGFGLGFDRLLAYLAGLGNIKDVVPWPRYFGRCDC